MAAHSLKQSPFYLGTGIVLVVQDAEFGVSAFPVEVETVATTAFVEVNSVLHQLADAVGCLADGHLNHLAVAYPVASHKGVVDVFVETVAVVHDSGYASLGIACGALGGLAFAQDTYFPVRGHLQGKTQTGNTGPDN